MIVPVPGVDTPLTTIVAPVGIVARPIAVAFWVFSCTRRVSIEMLSYTTPTPALSTVLLSPKMSHASPNRGAKLLWSPLYGLLICCPTCTRPPKAGSKLPRRLCCSRIGVTSS